MGNYKVIATLTWEVETQGSRDDSLDLIKAQLGEILDGSKGQKELDSFSLNLALVKMKKRKRLVHLGEFDPNEVIPYITNEESRRQYIVNGQSYFVRMNSDRYFVFKNSLSCAACGITGTKMILDINQGDNNPHFNLYAVENDDLVLMTKDHIIPKSKGGLNDLSNYATMCSICNNLKSNYQLTYDQVADLRKLHNNDSKLSKKELKDLINSERRKMVDKNSEGET